MPSNLSKDISLNNLKDAMNEIETIIGKNKRLFLICWELLNNKFNTISKYESYDNFVIETYQEQKNLPNGSNSPFIRIIYSIPHFEITLINFHIVKKSDSIYQDFLALSAKTLSELKEQRRIFLTSSLHYKQYLIFLLTNLLIWSNKKLTIEVADINSDLMFINCSIESQHSAKSYEAD